MAVAYQQQGKLEKALEIFNSVLETTIRVCVAVSPKTAGTYLFFYNDMACLHAKCDTAPGGMLLEKTDR